jgi:hypothetical protein
MPVPEPEPSPGAVQGGVLLSAPARQLEGALLALQATGAAKGEAFGLVAKTHDPARVQEALRTALLLGGEAGAALDGYEAAALLGAIASHAPGLAQWGLAAWGEDRLVDDLDLADQDWVQALPDGLVVEGDCDVRGCRNLRALPRRLRVEGCLIVFGCSTLVALPEDLEVGRNLMLDADCGLFDVSDRLLRRMAPGLQEEILRY